MSRINKQYESKITITDFTESVEFRNSSTYPDYECKWIYDFDMPVETYVGRIVFIGEYYSNKSHSQYYVNTTFKLTDDSIDNYSDNVYTQLGPNSPGIHNRISASAKITNKPVKSISACIDFKLRRDAESTYGVRTDSIQLETYTVTRYYDLTIIDCLIDGKGNVLESTTRKKTEYEENKTVSVSRLSKYSVQEYEIYSSVNKNSGAKISVTLTEDTTVYWYYRKRYSNKIYDKCIQKLKRLIEICNNIILKE